MTPHLIVARRDGMVTAIRSGGGTSLDAVEATIRVMEDSGLYDSGRGASYTRDGVPEMDAAIMDGRTLQAGSVASVRHIANPIYLARPVMEAALNMAGNLAAGPSTGGTVLKMPGRVGDSPIIGGGEYLMRNVRYLHVSQNGDGGVIALDKQGNIAAPFNTTGMMTGAVHSDGQIKMSGWSKNAVPVTVPAP